MKIVIKSGVLRKLHHSCLLKYTVIKVVTQNFSQDINNNTDMPPGTDCPYPIRILAFFEMIRPYHVVIRI